MTTSPTDSEILRTLGGALLALATSALLLVLLIIAYAHMQVPQGANTTHSKAIALDTLIARMGTTGMKGDALEVTALDTLNNNQHALVSLKTSLRAENYPFLTYNIEGWHAGMRVNVIWRSARNPRGLSTAILNRNLDGAAYFNLAGQDNWKGTITEVGLHLQGELRDEPIEIDRLTLEPHGWRNTLSTIWSEWTAFRGWTGTSINFLTGTPDPTGNATLSPTLATALWCGLSLMLLYVSGAIKRSHTFISYGAVILIPWICIDLIWQKELSTQLSETRYLFAGKSQEQKRVDDVDGDIFEYARHLKTEVLGPPGTRLFILHDIQYRSYPRLRLQYHLLPHTTFNFDRYPKGEHLRKGDLILVMGAIKGLRFLPESSALDWGYDFVPVELLDKHDQGSLFLVVGPANG